MDKYGETKISTFSPDCRCKVKFSAKMKRNLQEWFEFCLRVPSTPNADSFSSGRRCHRRRSLRARFNSFAVHLSQHCTIIVSANFFMIYNIYNFFLFEARFFFFFWYTLLRLFLLYLIIISQKFYQSNLTWKLNRPGKSNRGPLLDFPE